MGRPSRRKTSSRASARCRWTVVTEEQRAAILNASNYMYEPDYDNYNYSDDSDEYFEEISSEEEEVYGIFNGAVDDTSSSRSTSADVSGRTKTRRKQKEFQEEQDRATYNPFWNKYLKKKIKSEEELMLPMAIYSQRNIRLKSHKNIIAKLKTIVHPRLSKEKKFAANLTGNEIDTYRCLYAYARLLSTNGDNNRVKASETAVQAIYGKKTKNVLIRIRKQYEDLAINGKFESSKRGKLSHAGYLINDLDFKSVLRYELSKEKTITIDIAKRTFERAIQEERNKVVALQPDRVRKWLGRIAYNYKHLNKKGMYCDGHNAKVNVDHNKGYIKVIGRLKKDQRFVTVYQDECAINSVEGVHAAWVDETTGHGSLPCSKSKGQSYMISAFYTENGVLDMDLETFKEKKSSGYVGQQKSTIGFAVKKDEYWTADRQLKQVETAMDIFEELYPDKIGAFIFDQSTCHACYGVDALKAERVGCDDSQYGLKIPKPNGITQKEWDCFSVKDRHFVPRDTFFVKEENGIKRKYRQSFRCPSGVIKGKKRILTERGISILDEQGHSIVDKCAECATIKGLYSFRDDRPTRCCLRRILSLQPDFASEKPLLFHAITKRGHICLFLAKFHCELNVIELFWAQLKFPLKKDCEYNYPAMMKKFHEIWDKIWNDSNLAGRLFRKVERFEDAYRRGLEGVLADYVVQQFKGHRRIPKSVIDAVTICPTITKEDLQKLSKKAKDEMSENIDLNVYSDKSEDPTLLEEFRPVDIESFELCKSVALPVPKPKKRVRDMIPFEGTKQINMDLTPVEYSESDVSIDASEYKLDAEEVPLPEKWDEALALNKDTFGNCNGFKDLQVKAIIAEMNHDDLHVKLPTGYGKSLCFQLPALMDENKTTIVISPLRALIQDQWRELLSLNIDVAGWIDSNFSSLAEHEAFIDKILKCTYRILYITPERLSSNKCIKVIETLVSKRQIRRFVVDESHCISEWGHSFRPDYLELKNLRRKYPSIPISSYTATANLETEKEIQAVLGLKDHVIISEMRPRTNLKYMVKAKNSLKATVDSIKKWLKSRLADSGIIYCTLKQEAEDVANLIAEAYGSDYCTFYHAGMDPMERNERQADWKEGKIKVMVATIAFGMGINKQDVRFILHLGFPNSIAGYYQESGRAGRDQKPAVCILYFALSDRNRAMKLLLKNEDSDKENKKVLMKQVNLMTNYCLNRGECRHVLLLKGLGEKNYTKPLPSCKCDNCSRKAPLADWKIFEISKSMLEVLKFHENNTSTADLTAKQLINVLRGTCAVKVTEKENGLATVYKENIPHLYGCCCSLKEIDLNRVLYKLISLLFIKEVWLKNKSGYSALYLKPVEKSLNESEIPILQTRMIIPKSVSLKARKAKTRVSLKGNNSLEPSEYADNVAAEDSVNVLPKRANCNSIGTRLSVAKKLDADYYENLQCLLKTGKEGYLNDTVMFDFVQNFIQQYNFAAQKKLYIYIDSLVIRSFVPEGFENEELIRQAATRVRRGECKTDFDNLFQCKLAFFPMNILHTHWFFVSANMKEKVIRVHESLQPKESRKKYAEIVLKFLQQRAKHLEIQFDWSEWIVDIKELTLQKNGYDCGVFVVMKIKALCRKVDVATIEQKDMQNYRNEILDVLLKLKKF